MSSLRARVYGFPVRPYYLGAWAGFGVFSLWLLPEPDFRVPSLDSGFLGLLTCIVQRLWCWPSVGCFMGYKGIQDDEYDLSGGGGNGRFFKHPSI